MAAPQKVYDAIIIGGGPAGLSAALGLSRICRSSILFDSGEYRNQGSTAMHTYLTRDGIDPGEFRLTGRREIERKYSAYATFVNNKIVSVKNTDILPDYKGFEAVDSTNTTYRGRKLVLATGTEDVLPSDIEGYKENWPSHMWVSSCPILSSPYFPAKRNHSPQADHPKAINAPSATASNTKTIQSAS